MPTVAALVATLALAAPAPTTKQAAVLLVPMDLGGEGQIVKLEGWALEALERFSFLKLKKTDELFGIPADAEAETALTRANKGYTEARAAFEGKDREDAERKLKNVIKEYAKAAAAIRDRKQYADATAMYAAVLLARGLTEEARLAMLDLISVQPDYELSTKRFPQTVFDLRSEVMSSRAGRLRGNFTVKTRPWGARVFLDGELMGHSPITLPTLTLGKHHVRVERPGFKQFGAIVNVTPEGEELDAELRPTAAYRQYDALLDKLAGEVLEGHGGPTMKSLSKSLNLQRAVVGVVKELTEGGSLELLVGLFDLNTGRRLGGRKLTFQGDEYGQLKPELIRVMTQLVNSEFDERAPTGNSADPLDKHSGMEEWSGEGRTTPNRLKSKKGSKDPLDYVSGTEDW
jgi:tetratricopeptide (TPR) repeat protein